MSPILSLPSLRAGISGGAGSSLPVTRGLQLYLDANLTGSYGGSGTAWNDLSGNGKNFNWNSTPTWGNDSGRRYFITSGNLAIGPDSNTFNIDNSTGFTIIQINNQRSNQSSHSFKFFGGTDVNATNSASRGIAPHATWSNGTIYLDTGGCCNTNQRVQAAPPDTYNSNWRMITFRANQSNNRRDIFAEKSSFVNNTNSMSNLNLTNRQVHLGGSQEYGNTSSSWDAWLSVFVVYNLALTDSEIGQLYDHFDTTFNFPYD